MTVNKLAVPRHRIPPLVAMCPRCGGGTKIIASTAFAEGYHRRHLCADHGCDYAFYTITPYDGREARMSPLPFKDRSLTQAEYDERLGWWTETTAEAVTSAGNPFLNRMAAAINKQEEDRDEADKLIVSVYEALKRKVDALNVQPVTQESDENA